MMQRSTISRLKVPHVQRKLGRTNLELFRPLEKSVNALRFSYTMLQMMCAINQLR
jgi:hypothetical protein